MKNIFAHLSRLSYSLPLPRVLMISALIFGIGSLAGCSQSKWQGTWELTDPGSQQKVQFFLTKEGKLYVIPPNAPEGESVAYEVPVEKVSEDAELPEDTQIISLEEEFAEQAERAKQSEGKTYTASLARAQQAYFVENQQFAGSIDELGMGIETETDNYKYEIASQDAESVTITATAKGDELRSYTGAVFIFEVEGQQTPVAGVCETDEPSKTPPAKPESPDGEGNIDCPSGSSPLS